MIELTNPTNLGSPGPIGTVIASTGFFTDIALGTTSYSNYRLTLLSTSTSGISVNNSQANGAGSGAGIAGHTTNLTTAVDQRLGFFLLGYTDLGTDRNSAGMAAFSAEAWTAGSLQGTYLDLQTTPVGSATRATVLRIQDTAGATLFPNTAIPAGGATGFGYKLSSTANFGVFHGSGVPTLGAAVGSFYMRSDGSSTTSRAYVATSTASSSGSWASLTASS